MPLAVVFKALKAGEVKLTDEMTDERERLAHGRRAVAHLGDVRADRHARRRSTS